MPKTLSGITLCVVFIDLLAIMAHGTMCEEHLRGGTTNHEVVMIDKSLFRINYPQNKVVVQATPGSDLVILRQQSNYLGSIKLNNYIENESQTKIELRIEVNEEISDRNIVYVSMLKALLGRISFFGIDKPLEVIVDVPVKIAEKIDALTAFGFQQDMKSKEKFFVQIRPEQLDAISEIKIKLSQLKKTEEPVGRGFVIDASIFSEQSLAMLMEEYNDLAWGRTSWAKHAIVAEDELEMIRSVCGPGDRVLEVGAGSGRLTVELAKYCGNLTASDYLPEVIARLSSKIQNAKILNVNVFVDDITKSALPAESFDKVFFLENGLGGLLSRAKRFQAIQNIRTLLTKDGVLVLGLRTLGEKSGDHVMPASQDDTFFGIYHTFSKEEVEEYAGAGFRIVNIVKGDIRPAGGHQLFAILQKVSR